MLDITEINDTIKQLENGSTTFDNCLKLASLYIVKENMVQDNVEQELDDILPAYRKYIEVKRKYQLHETTQDNVLINLKSVCTEIKELLLTLYNCTDFEQERNLIRTLFNEVRGTLY